MITGNTLARPVLHASVTIGGKEAEVEYAGAAPQLISGVLQVNVRIPDDAPRGDDVPVVLTVGDHRSRDGVTRL